MHFIFIFGPMKARTLNNTTTKPCKSETPLLEGLSHYVEKMSLKIAIVHIPFFGITGSDRLIIDASLDMQAKGHDVTIFTTDYHLKTASFFDEQKLKIVSINSHLPASIAGFGSPFLYLLKSIILVFLTFNALFACDIVGCDLLPTPLLWICFLAKITRNVKPTLFYYCHFPDCAIRSNRGLLRGIYRSFLHFFERNGMSCADVIYANSGFTKTTILTHYPKCKRVKVLHPGIPEALANFKTSDAFFEKNSVCATLKDTNTLCSINRIAASKSLERAILLASAMKRQPRLFTTVIAGGIGSKELGGLEYLDALKAMCKKHSLTFAVAQANNILVPSSLSENESLSGDVDVLFLLDATDDQRDFILSHSRALFYTSSKEHFGMGLPEGMLSHCFVIGMASGGPLEIIEHMVSGYLIPDHSNSEDSSREPFSPPDELVGMLERLYGGGDDVNSAVVSKEIPQDLQAIIQNGFDWAQSKCTINTFTKTILADHAARLSGNDCAY